MTHKLLIGGHRVDADLIVFDKDGTLIDFTRLWHGIAIRATENLIEQANLDASVAPTLYAAMGFNPDRAFSDADGALAVGPNERIYAAVVEQLCVFGTDRTLSQEMVRTAFAPVMEAVPANDDIVPCGDVSGLFNELRDGGIKVAVATTDLLKPTRAALAQLNVLDCIDELICADDPQRRTKPDPLTLIDLANRQRVEPEHTVMVGDTIGDMRMAKRAGTGMRVGVLTGAGDRDQLTPWCSCVISGIDEIKVLR